MSRDYKSPIACFRSLYQKQLTFPFSFSLCLHALNFLWPYCMRSFCSEMSVQGFHWRNLQTAHVGQVIVNTEVTEKVVEYLWRAGEMFFFFLNQCPAFTSLHKNPRPFTYEEELKRCVCSRTTLTG